MAHIWCPLQRSVFCVGEHNSLKLFTLVDEWQEVKLSGSGEIAIHPLSKLSGSVHGNDSFVFFEDVAGHLRGVQISEGGHWEYLPFDPVKSVPGGPHFAQVRDDTVHLSYVHQDGCIHQRAMHIKANDHNGTSTPPVLSSFTNFSVANKYKILLLRVPNSRMIRPLILFSAYWVNQIFNSSP
jgi:hypothetical protein